MTTEQLKETWHGEEQLPATIEAAEAPPTTAFKALAMLCLQSDRYDSDTEFRDATDAVLAWVNSVENNR